MSHAALRKQLFAVESYDPATQLFTMHPNFHGFGFLCEPLAGYDEGTAAQFNMLLTQAYPAGTVVQLALWTSPDVEDELARYQDLRSGARDRVLRRATQERVRYLRAHTDTPVDQVSGLRIHHTQLIITVKLPLGASVPTEAEIERAVELRLACVQTLKAIGIRSVPLDAARYCRILSAMLNHGAQASWRDSPEPWYDEDLALCNQILDASTQLDVDERALTLGETRVRVLSPKKYPADCEFGLAMKYVGDIMSGARGIREPVLITLNLVFPDHESRRSKLEADRIWAEREAGGKLARWVRQLSQRKESHDIMWEALQDGDRIVRGYLGVAVFAPTEERSQAAAMNCRTYFRELGFQLLEDRFIVAPLFVNLLPFGTDLEAEDTLMRYKTFASRHFGAIAPIMSPWRGTGTPLMTLLTRDGNLMAFSPFDAPTAPHMVMAGITGSGKSFAAQELLFNARAAGCVIRVIDIGRSYANLCEVLGGQFIEFSEASTICLNPFTHITNFARHSDALVNLIQAMAAPAEPLSSVQLASLRKILSEVFTEIGAAMTIDDLAAALLDSEDPRVADVGTCLYPFTQRGEYGRFFHGRCNLDIQNPFVVLELEELRGRRQLQKVVLMQLMHAIYQEAFLGDRSTRFACVIDECWQLLDEGPGPGGSEIASFIEFLWRTGRKVGLGVSAISQDVQSFANSKAGQAILSCSPNMMLLKQRPEAILKAKKDGHLALGDYGFSMLNTVHSLPGEYSEILLCSEGAIGVGRLTVSEYSKLLYSTKPDDVARIRRLKAEGMSVDAAIEVLLTERTSSRRSAA